MTIPPLLVYLAGIALVLFIGGTLAGLHSLRRRVRALEEGNTDLRGHVVRLEGIMYRLHPDAFRTE